MDIPVGTLDENTLPTELFVQVISQSAFKNILLRVCVCVCVQFCAEAVWLSSTGRGAASPNSV